MKPLKVLRKGWKVRRAGNPRTEVGRARKAQVFEVVETIVDGLSRCRFHAALLRGHGQSFWVNTPERWERVT
jgi:hypothetical protein